MQQFKRADPERLKHATEECTLGAALGDGVPEGPLEERVAGTACGSAHPATESDAAAALALQQEFAREGAAGDDSLEERGLFFCQICQKDLSTMNLVRREQHVNRCLDEAEKPLRPSAPRIPECPICGKPFLTLKSRIGHLKQCAARMEVGPQLLLQAVRMQAAQPQEGGGPPGPSLSDHVGGLKRKGATNMKEPQKRRKVGPPEAQSEDLLVAIALSRSEMEQCPAVPALRLESAFSKRMRPGAEKKGHRKKLPVSPPQLLVQDPETTGRQIEDRVALLLSEGAEMPHTPPLPASGIVKEEVGQAGWRLPRPEGKQNPLWEGSALTAAWAPESFYSASLVPPIMPWRPAKFYTYTVFGGLCHACVVTTAMWSLYLTFQDITQEPTLSVVWQEQVGPGVQRPAVLHSTTPTDRSPGGPSPSASQRERQALQDLGDLAREGLSTSPGPGSGGLACSGGAAGSDLAPSGLPLTGFVRRPATARLHLRLLATELGAMVNNPHLSDVQFQMDSGEVLYAHKFVLYARCPLLMRYVSSEGFSAEEDGDLALRVLLSDVSAEATCAFLRYLYTADPGLPPCLTPGLSSLALRFGVSELVHLCEQAPEGRGQEEEGEDCTNRAESFQELLRSVWADEEEAETPLKPEDQEEDREKVNEAEMDEIYEFAATQRKLLQQERADLDEDMDQPGEDSPGSGHSLARVQASEQWEKAGRTESPGLVRDEGKEGPCAFLSLRSCCSDRGGEAESHVQGTPGEALDRPSSPSPPRGCRAERRAGPSVHTVHVHDHGRLFSATREFSDSSQVTSDPEELSGTARERGLQAPRPHPCCFLSQPLGGRSPDRSHHPSHHATDLSLWGPQLPGGVSKVASPKLPSPVRPSQQRASSTLTRLTGPGQQKGKESESFLISPEKSPPIDLTQCKPGLPSPGSLRAPLQVDQEEVILLLDSDEELELEQTKLCSNSNGPPDERKVEEESPSSAELFPVIDVDAGHERSQSPPGKGGELQPEGAGQPEMRGSLGGRGAPWLFWDRESSPDEGSTTDSSWLNVATVSDVVEVQDSDDEQDVTARQASSSPLLDSDPPVPVEVCYWNTEPLSPIPIDHLNLARTGPLSASSPSSGAKEALGHGDCCSPELPCTSPVRRSRSREKSPRASSPGSHGPSFLNSALWDDWDGGEQEPPEAVPRAQTLSAPGAQEAGGPETPKGADWKKNLPPKVPITPMPRYSIMETPVLKKELDRFGVRPLPKRQMVLKLKEIFQYTHQTLDSGSDEEIPPSQTPLEAPGSQSHTETCRPPRAGGCTQLAATVGPGSQKSQEHAVAKDGHRRRQQHPGGGLPPRSRSPVEEAPLGPDGDTQHAASREPAACPDGSDSSFSSQSSSSCEFGAAFESASEDDAAADTQEAVRRYIRSQPALYRKVLRYQPFELAELQAELRQNGIRVAAGPLLDFLDAQGITFTTAAARKEKLKGKKRRPPGKKKGERD
ncbi:Structure-specific endonuclease subunit SLX4 [Tupaia chinensis]|uniref:Structure-specific endonuclease subunit SLX4 n=1 Tax=Tupaia chinensis TaxID=246437 RepID=L9LAL5_TUPCH|nr:Structure-specific endonuclease subunit SLX4 [Tupaia chinensis]